MSSGKRQDIAGNIVGRGDINVADNGDIDTITPLLDRCRRSRVERNDYASKIFMVADLNRRGTSPGGGRCNENNAECE